MAELVVRFDLRFSRAVVRAAVVAAMLLGSVSELGSESLTLTTYYPAPSGIYTRLIATNNTWLARDAGNVMVGGMGPATQKLELANGSNMRWGNGSLLQSDQGGSIELGGSNGITGVGVPYVDFHYTGLNQDYNIRMINDAANQLDFQTAAGGVILTLTGAARNTTTISGDATVSNNMKADTFVTSYGGGLCVEQNYNITGVTNCPGGTYATTVSGMIANKMLMPYYTAGTLGNNAQATMLCCNCPSGGCPSLP